MLGKTHTALLLVLMMLAMPALGRDDGHYANSPLKSNIATATYRERPLELSGTYRLISTSRRILDTGEEVSAFGKNAKGSIIYGNDGRFLVLITNDGRPKPESNEAITDQQRADLHRTMSAYGGTYSFDGKKVEHHIELAWNEVWAGTTVIRDVKVDGNRVIYTARPARFSGDGKMSVITLVWEKVGS